MYIGRVRHASSVPALDRPLRVPVTVTAVQADRRQVRRELLELGSATLGESGGRPMRARVKPAWPGARLAAPAVPVRCTPGDNLAIHVAVATAPRGHVLVVDVGDVDERGYWGEVLTTGAESRGLSGLVIDGGVRDIDAMEAHGFPVFSSAIALRGATKQLTGDRRGAGGGRRGLGCSGRLGGRRCRRGDGRSAAALSRRCSKPGRARAQKEAGMFESAPERLDDDGAAGPRSGSPVRGGRLGRLPSSLTRFSGSRPARISHTPSQARRAMRVLVARVALPMWGRSTARGSAREAPGGSSARLRTRRARRRRSCRSSERSASAASSTTGPREVLTSTPSRPSSSSCRLPIRWRVSSVRGTWRLTMSDAAISSSRSAT